MNNIQKYISDEYGEYLNPVWIDIHYMEMRDNSIEAKARRIVEYYESWGLDVDLDEEIRKLKRIEDYYDSFDIL